jgi:hypothetical protein
MEGISNQIVEFLKELDVISLQCPNFLKGNTRHDMFGENLEWN